MEINLAIVFELYSCKITENLSSEILYVNIFLYFLKASIAFTITLHLVSDSPASGVFIEPDLSKAKMK